MPFYLYKRAQDDSRECLGKIGKISLGGRNAIFRAWKGRGKMVNRGWHVTGEELIKEADIKVAEGARCSIIIDYDPGAKHRIELLELLDIYVYTYGNTKTGTVWWSPLMLRLRTVWHYESKHAISKEQRIQKIERLCEPKNGPDIFEFLYLQGEDRGWAWGRVGQVNAPLIEKEAREYFKIFFCEGVTEVL